MANLINTHSRLLILTTGILNLKLVLLESTKPNRSLKYTLISRSESDSPPPQKRRREDSGEGKRRDSRRGRSESEEEPVKQRDSRRQRSESDGGRVEKQKKIKVEIYFIILCCNVTTYLRLIIQFGSIPSILFAVPNLIIILKCQIFDCV